MNESRADVYQLAGVVNFTIKLQMLKFIFLGFPSLKDSSTSSNQVMSLRYLITQTKWVCSNAVSFLFSVHL